MATTIGAERLNWTTVLDRNLEEGRESRPAFSGEERSLSYAELYREVSRTGHRLRDLGLDRGDRILMVLDDTPCFPVLFLAAIRIGAVPMPVSPLDKADNLRHFVADSYTNLVAADAAAVPALREALPGHAVTLLSFGGPAEGAIDFEAGLDEFDDELEPVSTHRDDVAFWLFSSGSTGPPKGVVHLHHDIGVTCERFAGEVLGYREEDVSYSTTKLHHAYGLGNALTFPLHFGASSVLITGPSRAQRVIDALRRFRPSLFFSVPALYAAILRESDTAGALESVRICVSAAEALPPTTLDRWIERFSREIVDGIGSTEMLHIYCSNRPGEVVRGTTGRPVPGYELRITDDDGAEIRGPGVGNLEVRGDSCAAYYWHQHEKSKSSMRGEWFFTGDRYRYTEDGYFVYEGRADDMMKVGGLWVSPTEVEAVLLEHQRVLSAGVVGVVQEDLSRIAAFVIRSKGGPSDEELANELRDWCKQRLRRYEYPHVIRFVEELPLTLSGKVQRFRLRELTAEVELTPGERQEGPA